MVSTEHRRPPVALTLRAALDALECQVAVVSASGRIVVANEAWRRITAAVPSAAQGSPGANYFDVFRDAQLPRETRTVAQGVRDVLAQKSRKARRDTGQSGPATQQSKSNTRGGTR